MPTTDKYSWTTPTVGGSAGTWGTELNELIDDEIEEQVKANENTAAAALPKAGGVMTGFINIRTSRYNAEDLGNISGATSLNAGRADVHFGTVTGDVTFSFINWKPAGKAGFLTLELVNGGAHSVTWPAEIEWDGGAAPTLQNSGTDMIVFYSRDTGTTVRGMHSYSVN